MAVQNQPAVPGYNRELTILASASPKASWNTTFRNDTCVGIVLVVDITAKALTPTSIVVTIKGYDPATTKLWTILASAALTDVGTTVLRVYPTLTAAANSKINDALPAEFNIDVVSVGEDGTNFFTYTIGASLLR